MYIVVEGGHLLTAVLVDAVFRLAQC